MLIVKTHSVDILQWIGTSRFSGGTICRKSGGSWWWVVSIRAQIPS